MVIITGTHLLPFDAKLFCCVLKLSQDLKKENKGSVLHFHEMPCKRLVFLHFYTIGIFVVDLSRHVLGGAMSAYYNSSCIVQHWKTTTPETILKTYKVKNFEKLNSYKN